MVSNKTPILPGGKPFRENHSKYDTGKSQMVLPAYFPKGIFVFTNSSKIRESGKPSGGCGVDIVSFW